MPQCSPPPSPAWVFLGKPDLGMTINGCLAGLGGHHWRLCLRFTWRSRCSSELSPAFWWYLLVVFFDRIHIDDPVGATSVHLGCGVFGTLCVGLFAKEGVTSLSTANGLFYGGGLSVCSGVELLGIVAIGAFVFAASSALSGWCLKTHHRHPGLHGGGDWPGWTSASTATSPIPTLPPPASYRANSLRKSTQDAQPLRPVSCRSGGFRGSVEPYPLGAAGPKMTKVIHHHQPVPVRPACRTRWSGLGVTGMTVTNVFGYGVQKGHATTYYRGAPVEARLLPKVKIDVVICKNPHPDSGGHSRRGAVYRKSGRWQDLHLRRGTGSQGPHRPDWVRRPPG